MGIGLDPMSILVPFLIFSIGVSHAVQMTNAWKLETLNGGIPYKFVLRLLKSIRKSNDGIAKVAEQGFRFVSPFH